MWNTMPIRENHNADGLWQPLLYITRNTLATQHRGHKICAESWASSMHFHGLPSKCLITKSSPIIFLLPGLPRLLPSPAHLTYGGFSIHLSLRITALSQLQATIACLQSGVKIILLWCYWQITVVSNRVGQFNYLHMYSIIIHSRKERERNNISRAYVK
jgi:hypothetical protein